MKLTVWSLSHCWLFLLLVSKYLRVGILIMSLFFKFVKGRPRREIILEVSSELVCYSIAPEILCFYGTKNFTISFTEAYDWTVSSSSVIGTCFHTLYLL